MDSLFTVALPASFSPQWKSSPSLAMQGLAHGFPQLQAPNCNSLLILNKPTLAGEISGSLFILGQHFGGPYGGQRWSLLVPGLVSKQMQYPQLSPLSLTAFLTNPGLSPGSSSHSLCLWSSSHFWGDLLKAFIFLVKVLFCMRVLFWHFGLIFEIRMFQLKLAEKLWAHSYGNKSCFTETVPVQLSAHSLGIGAIL